MVFCHWITAGYTSHCFNVFSVSKPFMLLSLCYTVTLSLAAPLISYFIRLLSLTASNQAFNKRNDVWATWNNWTEVQSIRHHNRNSVILGLGKSNKGNISWIRTGTEGRGARESLLSISGANLEVNTSNDMSTRTFTWSGMSLPAPWGSAGHEMSPKYWLSSWPSGACMLSHSVQGEGLMIGIFPAISVNKSATVQFSSVAQSCNPMDCSTPGLPVHHQLPEFTQTHVHRVESVIASSHLSILWQKVKRN